MNAHLQLNIRFLLMWQSVHWLAFMGSHCPAGKWLTEILWYRVYSLFLFLCA